MNKSLTESLAYDCVRLVFKSRLEDLTEVALNEGITDGILLLEEFDQQDAANLEKGVKQIDEMIAGLEKKFANAGDGWKPVFAALKKGTDGLDTKSIAQLAISGKTKDLAKASAKYTQKVQAIASEVAAILDATEQMRKNLKNFEADVGDKKTETIASLADSVESFPDLGKLDKGISSVYAVPKWFKSAWETGSKAAEKETEGGFFKKAMSFVGGLFKGAKTGRIVDSSLLADAIKATPYEVFMGLDLKPEVQALTKSSENTAGETTELASAGVAAQESGGDSGSAEKLDPKEAEALEKELGAPPAPPEEAEQEQAEAEENLKSAAQEAAAEEVPPGVAAANAIDAWASSLSDSSQKMLQTKDRIGSLKASINTSLEGAADALAAEVQKAIASWRSENEETLIKSKRFAKKNFDSLENLIPQIVGMMLKKTSESNIRLTPGMVQKSVYKILDRKFNTSGTLLESKRWETLAGIRRK
jgi:uncharacterized protein YoxC